MSSVDEHVLTKSILSRARLLIFITAVLWSFAGVFIKSLELHPLVITFYRSFFASLFFFLFVTRQGWEVSVPLLVSVTSYTAAISFFVWANKLTTAANAIVLQYTAPMVEGWWRFKASVCTTTTDRVFPGSVPNREFKSAT